MLILEIFNAHHLWVGICVWISWLMPSTLRNPFATDDIALMSIDLRSTSYASSFRSLTIDCYTKILKDIHLILLQTLWDSAFWDNATKCFWHSL
jgi:hypothetical protein